MMRDGCSALLGICDLHFKGAIAWTLELRDPLSAIAHVLIGRSYRSYRQHWVIGLFSKPVNASHFSHNSPDASSLPGHRMEARVSKRHGIGIKGIISPDPPASVMLCLSFSLSIRSIVVVLLNV